MPRYVGNTRFVPRDIKTFAFIEAYIRFHGFSPKFDEIARELGCTKQSVTRIIKRLEDAGCIKRSARMSRSIIPIKSPILT